MSSFINQKGTHTTKLAASEKKHTILVLMLLVQLFFFAAVVSLNAFSRPFLPILATTKAITTVTPTAVTENTN